MSAEIIGALGVNHKTAPVAIREKMAFSGDCQTALLAIRDIPGCGECCFLSTCNRVEVLFTGKDVDAAAAGVRRFLFANTNLEDEEAQRYSYYHQGQDAVRHIFRVASSLDSMIVGEPQILGQLKDAYRDASDVKATGVILNKLLHKAFSVAKRIRTETNIGSSAVSISYAAVELAKKIFGDLQGRKVLLIGAGEMAELAAQHLISQGIANVIVANRTFERAAKLARTFNGKAVGLDELVAQLEEVDIIISSTGAPGLVLKADDVRPVMRQRMNSPLFLIDIAVPRDLDPALNDLDNVYLYDIDDLKNVVEGNKAEREKEAQRAERIVEDETLKFMQWLEGMGVSPTIVALRQKAEEIRQAEFARTQPQLYGLAAKELKKIDAMTSAIINKLLHNPMMFLKANSSSADIQQKLDLVRQVFGLDEEEQD
jgi:glutamyl-tRNA reductase